MTLDHILPQEITDSQLWLSRTYEESIYKRNLKKKDWINNLDTWKYEKSLCWF